MKILVIEDEKKVASFIKKGLEEEYYTVDIALDGKNGIKLLKDNDYDLVILDLMLPYKDGFSIIKETRNEKITTPILILSAKDRIEDKVEGLDAGADDYLTKPFSFDELLARVRALLRRNEHEKSSLLKAGDLTLDTQTHKARRNNCDIELTPKEYSILEYLMKNKNKVVSRTRLSEHVYEINFDTGTNVIDVYINKLRNKLDKEFDQQLLFTVRSVGYMIKE